MSHSRSHKKNPFLSSNRHADETIPSIPNLGGKTWDTITKSEFLKIKESMTPEQRQALKDFTNPAKLANFDPDWVPPQIPDLPTDWQSDLPKTDNIYNDPTTKKKFKNSLPKGDEEPSSPDRPIWLPEGEDLDKMSATVRRAVAEIVQPVYEELVAQAHSAMEKSLGLSLVHCLWLEILNQQGCKSVPAELELLLGNDNRQKTIDQFLKLTNAKIRISNILTRLQELRLKQQTSSTQTNNMQNPKFDDKNQSPDFPAQDQKVQKQEFDDKNRMPDSPNQDLKPKAQVPKVQNCKFDHENQPPLPNQKAPIVQKTMKMITKNNRPSPSHLPPSPFRKTQTCKIQYLMTKLRQEAWKKTTT